jgi:hypothetical protein
VRAQGAALWILFHFFFSPKPGVYSRAHRGGQFLETLPNLVRLRIECRLWRIRGPAPGCAHGAATPRGVPEKSSLRSQRPQTQKPGRRKRACVNSNVRAGYGAGLSNIFRFWPFGLHGSPPTLPNANLPLSKKPLKSGLGFFCRLAASSDLLFSLPLGSPPHLLSPPPQLFPPPPPLSSVE